MGPRQGDVRAAIGPTVIALCLMSGISVVGGPVVSHQPGIGSHGSQRESVDLAFAEAFDHLQPGPSRRAAAHFNRAGSATVLMCRRYERIGKGVGDVFRFGTYPLTHESGCHEHRERVKDRA